MSTGKALRQPEDIVPVAAYRTVWSLGSSRVIPQMRIRHASDLRRLVVKKFWEEAERLEEALLQFADYLLKFSE